MLPSPQLVRPPLMQAAGDFGNVINGGHLNITSSSSIDTGTITGSGFNVTLASGNDSNITGAVGASDAAVGTVSMTPNGDGVRY